MHHPRIPQVLIDRGRLVATAILLLLFVIPIVPATAQYDAGGDGSSQPVVAAQAPTTMITIDSPSAGGQWAMGQDVVISGWAADPAGPATGVAAVFAYLDAPASSGGTRLKEATYGKARGDVASAFGRSDWTNVGYELPWNVSNVTPGAHTIYVYADPIAPIPDSYVTVNVTITAAAPTPTAMPTATATPSTSGTTTSGTTSTGTSTTAVVKILSPDNNEQVSGSVTVSATAADCATGTGASQVRVYADSSTGQLLGSSSDALTDDLSTVCSNQSGPVPMRFNIRVNTSSLSDGSHTIVAVATFGSGTAQASMNLRVNHSGSLNTNCNPYYPSYNASYPTNTPCSGTTGQCNPYYPNYNSSYPSNMPCSGTGVNTLCNPSYPTPNPSYPTNQPCTGTGTTLQCNPSYPTPNPSYPYNSPCSGTGTTLNCNPLYPAVSPIYPSNQPCTGSDPDPGAELAGESPSTTTGVASRGDAASNGPEASSS